MPASALTSILPNAQPASTQLNAAKMWGELSEWNPDAPINIVKRMVANSYRQIIDRRQWYGTLVKGQVVAPQAVTAGSVLATLGDTTIIGTGTSWDITMVGRQFRIGFGNPIYTITAVDPVLQTLDLDLPWGGKTQSAQGYQIFQNLFTLDPNCKSIYQMVNQRQGYSLKLHIPQDVLNIYDTWRTTTGWTYYESDREPAPDGSPQIELYPAPTFQQSFPFWAFLQPGDLQAPSDYPLAYIRSDVIVLGAIADVLLFRGKNSKYYDPNTSNIYRQRQEQQIQIMERADNNLLQQDLRWEFEKFPMTQFGASFYQSHDF
jgi:hypothetical protein